MGKRIFRKKYRLSFAEGHALEGLTVVLRSMSLGEALKLREEIPDNESKDPVALWTARIVARQLVEWDAEDEDGIPLPPTLEGVLSLETPSIEAIFDAWQEAVTAVPTPLEQNSTDGRPSVELSIPMEIPSESLAS